VSSSGLGVGIVCEVVKVDRDVELEVPTPRVRH
jgi:hypothetical protein